MKKILILIILSIILLTSCKESGKNEKSANIVIVMDKSYSMSETDKSRAAEFAAGMLVSACDDYKIPFYKKINTNINMGIVTFGREAEKVLELTSLYNCDEQIYEQIKEKISKINYDNQTGTNYYAGLDMAMEMCENLPADENIIFLMSDGQLDMKGLSTDNDDTLDSAENVRKEFLTKYNERLNSENTFSIFTIGIDTRKDKIGKSGFKDLSELVDLNIKANGRGKDYYIDNNSTDIADYFADFLENVYKLLNPYADTIEMESFNIESDGNICSFSLDKKYKTVQILIACIDENANNDKIKIEKIKSPKSEEPVVCQKEFKIDKSNITINENSGIAAGIYIDNAYRGKWEIYLNRKAKIIAKVFMFNPFPIYIIPICILIAVAIIFFIMWLLKIPPVRYRKKAIAGYLTVSKISDVNMFEEKRICTEFPLSKGKKYIVKGNITLATVFKNKKYKKYVLKYSISNDNFGIEKITIFNSKTNSVICTLYDNVETEVHISRQDRLKLLWHSY